MSNIRKMMQMKVNALRENLTLGLVVTIIDLDVRA
jgi:hypothetical protein